MPFSSHSGRPEEYYRDGLWLYSDATSYAPGDTASFFVSSPRPEVDCQIVRVGTVYRPGQSDDPECAALVAQACAAARSVGKPLGSIPRKGMTYRDAFAEGFQLVIDGADVALYREGVRQAVAGYREWANGST